LVERPLGGIPGSFKRAPNRSFRTPITSPAKAWAGWSRGWAFPFNAQSARAVAILKSFSFLVLQLLPRSALVAGLCVGHPFRSGLQCARTPHRRDLAFFIGSFSGSALDFIRPRVRQILYNDVAKKVLSVGIRRVGITFSFCFGVYQCDDFVGCFLRDSCDDRIGNKISS